MPGIFAQFGDYIAKLMSGGTFEIVLLIVLIVVGLILFLVALWIIWKLLALLGKGLLWGVRTGSEKAKEHSQVKKDARLAAPPPVATGWGSSPRIGLRRALAEAKRLTGPDAARIVVIAGDGAHDVCRSLGLIPPAVGTIGIAAGGNIILIDASKAEPRHLRRLASILPWRRPLDAVAVLVNADGVPGDAIVRGATLARSVGMRVAMHLVFPSSSKLVAWRIIESSNQDGNALCSLLAADTVRIWLTGGSREGLTRLALAQNRELPASINRALASAPSSVIDVASLSFGAGLKAAVTQTLERTRPAAAPGIAMGVGAGLLVLGVILASLVSITGLNQASALRGVVDTAAREASVPWTAEGIDSVPNGARIRRISGLSARLSEFSGFNPVMPLAYMLPNYSAPQELASAFLRGYVLRPLATSLDRRARDLLTPSNDPKEWLENARIVGEWFSAWEGLADDPTQVDLRRLFVDAFGGDQSAWAEGTDIALLRASVELPLPGEGGLDVDALTGLAKASFVITMQRWADDNYTNGPVIVAARKASDRSVKWTAQHTALKELRGGLQDPAQQWLTATKDSPDHFFELRILGRAVGTALLGQATALEAKAEISRIRIAARESAEYFLLPDVGPLMVRATSNSAGGGPSLSLTTEVSAWLSFLDRVESAGFANLPKVAPILLTGLVTVDTVLVGEARDRLRVFDQFASDLPVGLPPAVAQQLINELSNELVTGVTVGVEQALRPASAIGIPTQQANRLAQVAPALDDMIEIEEWLRNRQAEDEAKRVLNSRARVAEGVLVVSSDSLGVEDPIGMYIDPAADSEALIRRFDRGLARLQRIYEQLAAPFIAPASESSGWAAVEWKDIEDDIKGYERGDSDSTLSGIEGMLRAYAEDPDAVCSAPRALSAAGRDDYIARAMSRFRSQLDSACSALGLSDSLDSYYTITNYFNRNIAWLWPYSKDSGASELPPSALSDFVRQLHEQRENIARLDEPFARILVDNATFWSRDSDGSAAVRFRIEWRARPGEESFAENIIGFEFEGVNVDEDGVHLWRYGVPVALKLQLAQNSDYRFVRAIDSDQLVLVINYEGNGGLLRMLESLTNGGFSLSADIVNQKGQQKTLRATARVTYTDNTPISLPEFTNHPQGE